MPELFDCPWIERWDLLRDGTLPVEQQERFERHLVSCRAGQERLDRIEEDEVALLRPARQLGDPTLAPTDAALELFLERLQEPRNLGRTAPVEPPDLYFLHPTDRPDLLGTLGDYEVQEVIGQGGMGVVLKAFEPALNRLVAIKVLAAAVAGSVTARKRFTREAQAAAAVCHDHIVPVYGVQEKDGLPYLVMQYVTGESLQDRLDRTGPLELWEVVSIGHQTALGLAAAHARGLIHRDIKPANLLLESPHPPAPSPRAGEGEPDPGQALGSSLVPPLPLWERGLGGEGDRVKITDFGLARMVDDSSLTQNGVVAGTPEYMAPEQARGETVDHRADLFSLGSVLYTLCTGVSPFRGTTAVAVLHKVSEEEPTPLRLLNPAVPAWLEEFIAGLMAKDPADRFQATSEVAALLEGFLAHLRQPKIAAPEVSPALPPVRPGSPQQVTRLFSLPVGFLVPCVLVALVLGSFYWFAAGGAPEPSENKRELHWPLRGIPEDHESWELIGPDAKQCVKFEAEGLRLTLPAGVPNERQGTGVRIPMPAQGDFELTIHYQILTEPEQANAGARPTKLTFQAQLDRRPWTVAGLARRITSDKGPQFTTWTIRDNPGNNGARQTRARQHPAQARGGRLRIVRTGSEASFYAAEEPDGDFTLLPPPRPLGEEDLKCIELVGSTGGPKATLDVRFTDLHLQTSTSLAPPPAEGNARRTTRIALPILVVILSVLALVAWLRLRGGRREKTEQQASDSEEAPVVIHCPGCARGIKARPELAGKKVRCPGCGQGVRLP
jgi:serine/threonine protein kinase